MVDMKACSAVGTSKAVTYPAEYRSDAGVNTFIENLVAGALREYQLSCDRTQCILESLATASPHTPRPLVIREQVVHPDFVRALGDCRRNACRGDHIPRFLVVDLDSFRSFAVS